MNASEQLWSLCILHVTDVFQILEFHILDFRLLLFHQSQLAAARQRNGSHAVFTRNRFRIRRDHILEDAYNSMSQLSEEDLRGLVMFYAKAYHYIY